MTTDPVGEARRLLTRQDKVPPGCCHWCRLSLPPRVLPEGGWPAPKRRYCSQRCREAAQRSRAEAKRGGAEVILLALALARIPTVLRGDRLQTRGKVPSELGRAVNRHGRELARRMVFAALVAIFYDLGAVSPGPWLACSCCGWAQLVGREALGRRCRLTHRCPGHLAILLDLPRPDESTGPRDLVSATAAPLGSNGRPGPPGAQVADGGERPALPLGDGSLRQAGRGR